MVVATRRRVKEEKCGEVADRDEKNGTGSTESHGGGKRDSEHEVGGGVAARRMAHLHTLSG